MEGLDLDKTSVFLSYLDANNLYGWAMSQPLPVGDFKWMTNKELQNWINIPCVLEVDLEYPKEIHDLHNVYRLFPKRKKINNVEKLLSTLEDKSTNVVHYSILKQGLSLSVKLQL